MNRTTSLRSLVLTAVFSTLTLLGCGPLDESELEGSGLEEGGVDETGELADELTQTNLTCTATGTKFVLAPVSANSKTLRGRLTRASKTTTLSCVNQTGGAVKCSEAAPSTVNVTVAATGKTASLSTSATAAKVALKCVAPTPPAPKPPPPPPPPPALTYADVKPIIDGVCGQCHTEFSTLAAIRQMKTQMAFMLGSGRMPQNDPTFNTTPDGKKLLTWLQTGKDLQVP